MAAIINGDGLTFVGTPEQVAQFLGLMGGSAVVANMDRANIILVGKSITWQQVRVLVGSHPVQIIASSS